MKLLAKAEITSIIATAVFLLLSGSILLSTITLRNKQTVVTKAAGTPSCTAAIKEGDSCINLGEWCINCLGRQGPCSSDSGVGLPYQCINGAWQMTNSSGECNLSCAVSTNPNLEAWTTPIPMDGSCYSDEAQRYMVNSEISCSPVNSDILLYCNNGIVSFTRCANGCDDNECRNYPAQICYSDEAQRYLANGGGACSPKNPGIFLFCNNGKIEREECPNGCEADSCRKVEESNVGEGKVEENTPQPVVKTNTISYVIDYFDGMQMRANLGALQTTKICNAEPSLLSFNLSNCSLAQVEKLPDSNSLSVTLNKEQLDPNKKQLICWKGILWDLCFNPSVYQQLTGVKLKGI